MESVLVSIIIPTFNRSSLLKETLQSVQQQSLVSWECIIVDDGSNDDTKQIVDAFIVLDHRFCYFKRPLNYPKGACACRNYGFEQSTGKYIQWLDDDDLLSVNKLELQVAKLEKQKSPYLLATCSWDLLWPEKKLELKNPFSETNTTKENFYTFLSKNQSFMPSLTYLVPRELCLLAGDWNTALKLNQDAEYFNRVLVNSEKLMNVRGCYVLYREHNQSRLSRERSVQHIESFFLSISLMQAYLKMHNIDAKAYFKWKLLKWFLAYQRNYPEIIKKYHFLFLENGINTKWSPYYEIKHFIYKKGYPIYKAHFKKKLP